MKFSHREEQRDDRLVDVLIDEENGLRLAVSRLGAEPISLARKNAEGEWVGFLHRDNDVSAPDKGWPSHATVMGYFLHRLKDGHTLYRGREIKGGNHSFLRSRRWHLVDREKIGQGLLTYQVTPRDFTRTDYPLNVSLDLTYQIAKDAVTVGFRFKNDEPELVAHVQFGLHPGFAATSFKSFRFLMPAGKYRRYFAPENFLSGETEDIDFPGGEMPFDREKLPGSYILEMVDVPNREFVYLDPSGGRELVLDFTGVPYLTLWSDGGAFLCIEPCWGLTDHHKQRPFEEKAGMQQIPAQGELKAHFMMKPRLANSD